MKPYIYIFDLDGCIADSDEYVLTNEQARAIDPDLVNRPGVGFRGELTKSNKDNFCDAYFSDHQMEIKPYYGILSLFVRLSSLAHTAIITSRLPILRRDTIAWLEKVVSDNYSKETWRHMRYQLFFNEYNEKSLAYKQSVLEDLSKNYQIALIVDDHPEVAEYAKKVGIECLVPATGYKNLNGKDLMVRGKESLRKPKIIRRRRKKNDILQEEPKRAS